MYGLQMIEGNIAMNNTTQRDTHTIPLEEFVKGHMAKEGRKSIFKKHKDNEHIYLQEALPTLAWDPFGSTKLQQWLTMPQQETATEMKQMLIDDAKTWCDDTDANGAMTPMPNG